MESNDKSEAKSVTPVVRVNRWRNRETGKVFESDAMPRGPGWDLLNPDGTIDEEGTRRAQVGFRAGGSLPEPPREKPRDILRDGLEDADEILHRGLR